MVRSRFVAGVSSGFENAGTDGTFTRFFRLSGVKETGVRPVCPRISPRISQTWNRYAYVANAPLNAVDPLGLHEFNDAVTYNHDSGCYLTFSCTIYTDSSGMEIDPEVAAAELHNGSGVICQNCAGHPDWMVDANNNTFVWAGIFIG